MITLQSNSSKEKISLSYAVNDESLREDFLFQLDLKIPYCESVIYDPKGNKSVSFFLEILNNLGNSINSKIIQQFINDNRKKDFHTQIPFAPHFFLLNKKLPLFIGNKFFNGEFNQEELSHALITHEGRHLEQLAIGFPYFEAVSFPYFDNHSLKECWISGEINPIVIGCIAELDANYNSLLSIKNNEFLVRNNYKEKILDRYKMGISSLYDFEDSSKNNKEKEMIRKVLNAVPHKMRK